MTSKRTKKLRDRLFFGYDRHGYKQAVDDTLKTLFPALIALEPKLLRIISHFPSTDIPSGAQISFVSATSAESLAFDIGALTREVLSALALANYPKEALPSFQFIRTSDEETRPLDLQDIKRVCAPLLLLGFSIAGEREFPEIFGNIEVDYSSPELFATAVRDRGHYTLLLGPAHSAAALNYVGHIREYLLDDIELEYSLEEQVAFMVEYHERLINLFRTDHAANTESLIDAFLESRFKAKWPDA